MTLKDRIANDWQRFDGVETVAVTPADGREAFNASALQRMLSVSQMAMVGGSFGAEDNVVPWNFFQSSMGANVVAIGDRFTSAASGNWIIKSLDYSPQTSRWRCLCTRAL